MMGCIETRLNFFMGIQYSEVEVNIFKFKNVKFSEQGGSVVKIIRICNGSNYTFLGRNKTF